MPESGERTLWTGDIGRELLELDLDLDGSSWPFDLSTLVASPPQLLFSPLPPPLPMSLPPLTPSVSWAFADRISEIPSSGGNCSRLFQNGNTYKMGERDNFGDKPSSQLQTPAIKELNLSCLIKERMTQALRYFKETADQHVLVQVWAPVKSGSHRVLTTSGQPFVLDPRCTKLLQYRMVSSMYIFSVEDGDQNLGLPGRVFKQQLPEWTPNVQYYCSDEYKRLQHARDFNVRGTLALPVFEISGQSCLGVVELVMTSQKINYSHEVNRVCKALETVSLKSAEILNHPSIQIPNEGRQAALVEILEILTVVCETIKLPLAQTWVPCMHRVIVTHGGGFKKNCSSFDGSCIGQLCLSTTDVAFYVVDPHMWGFREACVEHHLQKGQGVAGTAFASRMPFFSADITKFSKSKYPLVHFAQMFDLAGCLAICLQSNHSGDDDYILEFFLPPSCRNLVEQRILLDSILAVIEQCSRNLKVRIDAELKEGLTFDMVARETCQLKTHQKSSQSGENHLQTSPEANNHEDLNGLSNEGNASHLHEQHLVVDQNTAKGSEALLGLHACQAVKLSEKRRGKAEKMISLEVLQQHFSGSLKDAARSLGVCPTTMKRICRQHGILRWPSRKINKVNRSLSKLKHVIDSVQGVEGAFDLNRGYPLPAPVGPALMPGDLVRCQDKRAAATDKYLPLDRPNEIEHQKNINAKTKKIVHDQDGLHPEPAHDLRAKNSSEETTDSPTSQGSCQGSHGNNNHTGNQLVPSDLEQLNTGISSEFGLQYDWNSNLLHEDLLTADVIEETIGGMTMEDSGSSKGLEVHYKSSAVLASNNLQSMAVKETKAVTIKASYKKDIIRFRLPYGAGILTLKYEVSKRLKLEVGTFYIKYLDDDNEWVILGCDSDMEECIEMAAMSGAHAIRVSVHDIMTNLGSSCESTGD